MKTKQLEQLMFTEAEIIQKILSWIRESNVPLHVRQAYVLFHRAIDPAQKRRAANLMLEAWLECYPGYANALPLSLFEKHGHEVRPCSDNRCLRLAEMIGGEAVDISLEAKEPGIKKEQVA